MATRTQIYLTENQRERLDALRKRDGRTLAAHVREALDRYLDESAPSLQEALDAMFGTMPDLEVPPRSESNRHFD